MFSETGYCESVVFISKQKIKWKSVFCLCHMRKWFELDLVDVRKEIETLFKVTLELRNHYSLFFCIIDRGGTKWSRDFAKISDYPLCFPEREYSQPSETLTFQRSDRTVREQDICYSWDKQKVVFSTCTLMKNFLVKGRGLRGSNTQ